MFKEDRIQFFATKSDLAPGLTAFESSRAVSYFLNGMFESPIPQSYHSIFEYDQLGISTTGSGHGDTFLITDRDKMITVRPIKQHGGAQAGKILYDISIFFNEEAIYFKPGGLYLDRGLIYGDTFIKAGVFDSESAEQAARELFKLFKEHLFASFIKVGPYYLGPEAIKLNQQGVRLITSSIDEPEAYDLDINKNRERRNPTKNLTVRQGYPESWRILQSLDYLVPGEPPSMPTRMPSHDDEQMSGLSFFRTFVEDDDLENLTLKRSFFGRSEIKKISFRNTDLSESSLTWNDFILVDFTDADLSNADLRANTFDSATFVSTDLSYSDLRHSTFIGCSFNDASMKGAKLTQRQANNLPLSEDQRAEIDWQSNDGELPDGG